MSTCRNPLYEVGNNRPLETVAPVGEQLPENNCVDKSRIRLRSCLLDNNCLFREIQIRDLFISLWVRVRMHSPPSYHLSRLQRQADVVFFFTIIALQLFF